MNPFPLEDASADMKDIKDWSRGLALTAGGYFLGLYQPSPETVGYWQGVGRRQLMLKWCPHCAKAYHPKRIVCTDCGATELGWRQATGKGSVYSFSEIHRAPSPNFSGAVPYTVGIVALHEGVHLLSRIMVGDGPIAIDAKVNVDFRVLESDQMMPVFITEAL